MFSLFVGEYNSDLLCCSIVNSLCRDRYIILECLVVDDCCFYGGGDGDVLSNHFGSRDLFDFVAITIDVVSLFSLGYLLSWFISFYTYHSWLFSWLFQ